jgi:hypothetical protein
VGALAGGQRRRAQPSPAAQDAVAALASRGRSVRPSRPRRGGGSASACWPGRTFIPPPTPTPTPIPTPNPTPTPTPTPITPQVQGRGVPVRRQGPGRPGLPARPAHARRVRARCGRASGAACPQPTAPRPRDAGFGPKAGSAVQCPASMPHQPERMRAATLCSAPNPAQGHRRGGRGPAPVVGGDALRVRHPRRAGLGLGTRVGAAWSVHPRFEGGALRAPGASRARRDSAPPLARCPCPPPLQTCTAPRPPARRRRPLSRRPSPPTRPPRAGAAPGGGCSPPPRGGCASLSAQVRASAGGRGGPRTRGLGVSAAIGVGRGGCGCAGALREARINKAEESQG